MARELRAAAPFSGPCLSLLKYPQCCLTVSTPKAVRQTYLRHRRQLVSSDAGTHHPCGERKAPSHSRLREPGTRPPDASIRSYALSRVCAADDFSECAQATHFRPDAAGCTGASRRPAAWLRKLGAPNAYSQRKLTWPSPREAHGCLKVPKSHNSDQVLIPAAWPGPRAMTLYSPSVARSCLEVRDLHTFDQTVPGARSPEASSGRVRSIGI